MRWKECQPIFKCHSLLFWIPALLCATDLNWVNITCGAPLGPSVHARVCECMHVCEHGNECFKPWLCASYRLASKTCANWCGASHHFDLCVVELFQLAMIENFSNQEIAWVVMEVCPYPILQIYKATNKQLLIYNVMGWGVQWQDLSWCEWHNWSLCGLNVLCGTYAWL